MGRLVAKRFLAPMLALGVAVGCWAAPVLAQSDGDIRQMIIRESIAAYSGSCPCPYNTARNGSQSGGRSAYSRPGGASPLCYPQDVSQAMVEQYRRTRAPARPPAVR